VSDFAACLAYMVAADTQGGTGDPPPGEPEAARGWLAERNLGLVPVREPASFTWPGPFLARLRDGWVVMFGVPPGVLHDPSGGTTAGPVEAAFVLAALNRGAAIGERPYGEDQGERGRVEAIVIAPAAEAPPTRVEHARAIAGRGLDGDRYTDGSGTFSPGPGGGRALTLIEGEVLDELGLAPEQARRNVVTRGMRLNPLVGARFKVGGLECAGRRLCEPCAHLERLGEPGMLRALVHRGGLRADILADGEIAVGDAIGA